MALEFLSPVHNDLVEAVAVLPDQTLGKNIRIHTASYGVPELEGVTIALLGVLECRNGTLENPAFNFDGIRKSLYSLYTGNWSVTIADLGDIHAGDQVSDTYFLVQEVMMELLRKNCIPILIGGSQDLVYPQYRAFDVLDRMVNLVNVDPKFDLGNSSLPITNTSFVGKIIINKPYNLFNYSNIGYQAYFNAQEEVDLIEKLYFDAYRLGTVVSDVTIVEPVMRDADIVVMDLGALETLGDHEGEYAPNGFNTREICAVSRYAGISDKVKTFGIFEYEKYSKSPNMKAIVAQIIWYFIEGVAYRSDEVTVKDESNILHYNVPVGDEILSFYKSAVTDRWWIEIPFVASGNNKLQRNTLLPCTYDDYEKACNQEIPERWYKAKQKNEV